MAQMKDTGFGKSDKQLAEAFGVSVSEIKKIKKQITSEITKPASKKPAIKRPAVKPAPLPKPKPKPLTGPAAVKAMQDRVSPAGVKKAEAGAKKAIDKKYPGLYKKSK